MQSSSIQDLLVPLFAGSVGVILGLIVGGFLGRKSIFIGALSAAIVGFVVWKFIR